MGNLLTYGGLTTKIKAMKSRLIQDEQFREMAGVDSVTSAVDFLKGLPSYSHILKGAESGELHRGQIEQLLLQAMYYDFLQTVPVLQSFPAKVYGSVLYAF